MSAPSNPSDLKAPSAAWQGTARQRTSNFADIARLWRVGGAVMEKLVAVVSHYAQRLIDRNTGKAYSVDELGLGERTKRFAIPLANLRVAAAWKDALPDSPAGNGGALGLGDSAGAVVTSTSTNNSAATESFGFLFEVPANYRVGQNLTVRIRHKFSVARFAASALGVVVKRLTADGALDATDLTTTTAINVKDATSYTDRDYTVNGNASGDELAAGTLLWIVVSHANIDTGGSGGAGVGTIAAVSVAVPVLG